MAFLGSYASNDSGGTIELDLVSVLQPIKKSRYRNHCRNAQFARDNRGVRKQTPTLH
jgi:hypothetical protein